MNDSRDRNDYAIAVAVSENKKLGSCSATYVAQQSCPKCCPFMGHGCYAEYGNMGVHTNRLNKSAKTKFAGSKMIALQEAEAIDRLEPRLDLRLHVVGDSRTNAAALIVALAARRYVDRAAKPVSVWTYTHAWRQVRKASWLDVSVLASCETPDQVRQAHELGYATAMVVAKFTRRSAYMADGIKILACPAQTIGTNCAACRLCMDAERLKSAGITIGFEAHGVGKGKVKERIALELVP
jgi:hypothetical protein